MKRYSTLLLSLFLGAIVAQPVLAACDVTPANTILPTGQSVKLTAACGVGITNINWKKDGTTIAGDVAITGSPTSVDFQIPTNLAGSAGGTAYVFSATANTGAVAAGNTAQVVVLAVGTAPTAPTTVTAAAGVGSISVAFSGGSLGSGSIVNYAATCGAYSASGMSSPIVVGGVANGAYTCTVTVTTTVGSATSAASNSVTVSGAASTPPTAPSSVVATAGYASLSVAFSGETLGSGTLVNYSANCGALTPVSGMTSPIVVTAVAGTPYTCTVTINTTAGSATSGASNTATPVAPALPAAPTGLTATAGNTTLSIGFTAGALNGGTLVNHHVTCTGPSSYYQAATTAGAGPVVMTGMVNGSTYTCWMRTQTNVGYSAWTSGVTGAPAAPVPPTAMTSVVATPGYGSLSVAFSGGTLGSGTLTNYAANCDTAPSAPVSNTGASSPIVVTAVGGSSYTCTVTTTTSVGAATSAASAPATPLVPAVPSAPTDVAATAGNAQLSIGFTAGALNGGTLVNHHVTCTGPSSYYQTATGGSSPIVVGGMTNGSTYTCWVRTQTNVGYSAWSSAASGTPSSGPTVPGAPTIGTATAGNASISVAFSAPGSNGGAAIDSYRATCGATTGTGAGSPVTVSGLTNGTPYTCTVAAHNSVGWGAESAASNSATPQAGSCGPGETFPIAGTDDAVWDINYSASYPGIGTDIDSLGTSGVALQFVPTTNRGITLVAGYGGQGTTGAADVTISTCPHNFTSTPGGQTWQCTRTGMTDLQTMWIRSAGGTQFGNECELTSGQTYYLNIRPNNGVAISKQLGYANQ